MKKILAILMVAVLLVSGAAFAEGMTEFEANDYLGEWVDQDGTTNIDIMSREEGDGYLVNVHMDVFDDGSFSYAVWDYGCVWDEETRTMKSFSRVTAVGDYEPDSEEEITDTNLDYTDAEFYFDEAGRLVWNDANESADDGMVFGHTIGWIDPDYAGPGHHFAGEWNDERVSIVILETMEDYQVTVAGSGSAFDGAYWLYTCDYDAETDSLVSNGEVAMKYTYEFDENEQYSEELVYEDGEAVFSLNEDGFLVWDDKKENAGEDRLFERAVSEDADAQEGAIVMPMDPGYDLAALGDGVYPAAFAPDALADGALTFFVYTEDAYDIADISQIAVGDTFIVSGLDFEVESVERGDDLLINGGLDEGGFTLHAFEEDNCWKVVMEDDYNTYSNYGETTLPLADDVTFTDGWDPEKEPLTATGAEAVAAAITGTDMDYFSPLNTTVCVENGAIVEIVRTYMP